MVSRAESLDVFTHSMERCTRAPLFVERFYARFLLSSDEIAARFTGVDLKRQAGVLRASLYHVMRAAQGSPDGVLHLEEIAATHSKRGYDIAPKDYDHWLECLIAVAGETDPTFDATTEAAWRLHLGRAIAVMINRYDTNRR